MPGVPSPRIDRLRAQIAEFGRTGAVQGLSPDFELHQADSIIDTSGVFRGPEGVQRSLDELRRSFAELTFEPEELIEAPGGEIVVFIRARGRGHGSGLELDNKIAWVMTFRGDELVRMVVHEERADALAAVGLPPRG